MAPTKELVSIGGRVGGTSAVLHGQFEGRRRAVHLTAPENIALMMRDSMDHGLSPLVPFTSLARDTYTSHEQTYGAQKGFVGGTITSGGIQNKPRNIARLKKATLFIAQHADALVREYLGGEFNVEHLPISVASSPFIIPERVELVIDRLGIAEQSHFFSHWRDVLGLCDGKPKIDYLFLIPGWRDSKGANDEFETAKKLHIPVIDLADDKKLIKVMDEVRRPIIQ